MNEEKSTVPGAPEPLQGAEELGQAIEAILFAAGYPVRYEKLAEVLGLSPRDVKTMVKDLSRRYEEDPAHGIQLLSYPTTCQLCTREKFAPYIREALGIRRGGNLSASSMEVLAVVAYNQPVTRSFIDLVRGVDSSYAVGSLLDKGLIEPSGRLDAPGRPMLYTTTDKFLRVFGISSLEELPETEALSAAAAEAESAESEEPLGLPEEELPPPGDYTAPVETEEENILPEEPFDDSSPYETEKEELL